MDKAQLRRWVVLLGALALTIGAIAFQPDEEGADHVEAVQRKPGGARPKAAGQVDTEAPIWIASSVDPFASKGWQPPPPPSQPVPVLPASVAVADTPPPPPPPLPFRFVGQMTDGADRVIYLSHGDQVVVAKLGDLLDGSYKVVSLSATQIEFESSSSGVKQMLAIPAQDN